MKEDGPLYRMHDLARVTGVSERTIRLWIELRVIPPGPVRGGSFPRYTQEHVQAIRRVQQARAQYERLLEEVTT